MEDPTTIDTLAKLDAEIRKILLVQDKGVLKIICATVIANRLDVDPIWLFLVAPPGGSKTEWVTSIEGLDFVHAVDTLTVNTFASGQKKHNKETSLLMKIHTGILTFSDFTTILGMNYDSRREIMGQLRRIYDGKFTKRTGNAEDVLWEGKIGMLAAVTSIIHSSGGEFSEMGERFIQYEIEQPDRQEVLERIFLNSKGMAGKRKHIQECMTNYLTKTLERLENMNEEITVPDEVKLEIIQIVDFITRARSAVIKDLKNPFKITFRPDIEMPTRVTASIIGLATTLMAINKVEPGYLKGDGTGDLLALDRHIIYKTNFDSIPRKRRVALQLLAKYIKGMSTGALATEMKYHTDVMKETLFELNALGLCNRKRSGSVDKWTLEPKFRDVIARFEKIIPVDAELSAEDDEEDFSEQGKEADDLFNDVF